MVVNFKQKNTLLTQRCYRLHYTIVFLLLFFCNYSLIEAKRKRKRIKRTKKQTTFVENFVYPDYSHTYSKFFDSSAPSTDTLNTNTNDTSNEITSIWENNNTAVFDELILSWNALRPEEGKISFFVSIKHDTWSPWHRIAEWGPNFQRTFINKLNPYVHTKHVRVEMQRGRLAKGFKIKAVFSNGAKKESLNALFACVSNMKQFKISRAVINKPTLAIRGVPQQSQMINHPRAQDLCSPASTSMIINYFARKLYGPKDDIVKANMRDFLSDFAPKVHDNGIDIYGNWLLNVAQAHDSSQGKIFYRVVRLNNFNELYNYLSKEIPVAVSVRSLTGGATPYANGHFIVVVGWNNTKKRVICIDPAFKKNKATLKSYKISHFLAAWGRSRNLTYIPIPRENWGLGG